MCGAVINNEFYKELGDKWYTAEGDAIALLRLEKNATNPWVLQKVRQHHGTDGSVRILDVGCGGGLLTFDLANAGWKVSALDVSEGVLRVGRARDREKRVNWVEGRAEHLPFPDRNFDVVCMMDVLEHIHEPKVALMEAVRVLKRDGTLLFHTFNKTWLAWLFAAKGLDWFIKDSQNHIHDWNLFIPPEQVEEWLSEKGMRVLEFKGLHPKMASRAFWKLVFTRRVPPDFQFKLGGPLNMGYLGCARFET